MGCCSISSITLNQIDPCLDFLVDTNVLFFVHSGNFTAKQNPKATLYSNFISDLLKNKNQLVTTTAFIQELFHCIENEEYKLYCKKNKLKTGSFGKKKFRALPHERSKLQKKLNTSFIEIKNFYDIIDSHLHQLDLDSYVSNYTNHLYDPIDYLTISKQCSFSVAPVNIITDDKDFQNDPSINVYYA